MQLDMVKSRYGVTREDLKILSRLSPSISLTRIGIEWGLIFGMIAISLHFAHPAIYVLAIYLIATRQHAPAVLLHEAAHYRLLNNHFWNDLLSDVFLAFPLEVSTKLYRSRHLKHHQFLNTDADPDWNYIKTLPDWDWPKNQNKAIALFIKDFLGLNIVATLKLVGKWSPVACYLSAESDAKPRLLGQLILFVLFQAVGIGLIYSSGHLLPYVLLWLVPSLTVLSAIFRIRGIAEHLGEEAQKSKLGSRTVTTNFVERLLLAPCNVAFHAEHHLFPSVPYYHLKKLSRMLMNSSNASKLMPKLMPKLMHVSNGYIRPGMGVFHELTIKNKKEANWPQYGHLFEFFDLPWLPTVLRNRLSATLELGLSKPFRDYYSRLLKWIRDPETMDGISSIVELGAGNAPLVRRMATKERFPGKSLMISDRFPNPELNIAFGKHPNVTVLRESVDFTQPHSWADGTLLVLSATLYHIPKALRSQVMVNLARSSAGVVIAEPLNFNLRCVFLAIMSFFPALAFPFHEKKKSFLSFFFSWLVPALPILITWDGLVSVLRQWRDRDWAEIEENQPLKIVRMLKTGSTRYVHIRLTEPKS